jgi:hypothetical protein
LACLRCFASGGEVIRLRISRTFSAPWGLGHLTRALSKRLRPARDVPIAGRACGASALPLRSGLLKQVAVPHVPATRHGGCAAPGGPANGVVRPGRMSSGSVTVPAGTSCPRCQGEWCSHRLPSTGPQALPGDPLHPRPAIRAADLYLLRRGGCIRQRQQSGYHDTELPVSRHLPHEAPNRARREVRWAAHWCARDSVRCRRTSLDCATPVLPQASIAAVLMTVTN